MPPTCVPLPVAVLCRPQPLPVSSLLPSVPSPCEESPSLAPQSVCVSRLLRSRSLRLGSSVSPLHIAAHTRAPPPLSVNTTPQGYYVELRLCFLSTQHHRVITWSSASAFCQENTTGLLRGAPPPLSVKITPQGYYVELRLRFLSRQHDRVPLLHGAPPPLSVKTTPQGYYMELHLRFLSRQHHRVITWSPASAFCQENTTGLLRGAPPPLSVNRTPLGNN